MNRILKFVEIKTDSTGKGIALVGISYQVINTETMQVRSPIALWHGAVAVQKPVRFFVKINDFFIREHNSHDRSPRCMSDCRRFTVMLCIGCWSHDV